jgi:hypothetical protein
MTPRSPEQNSPGIRCPEWTGGGQQRTGRRRRRRGYRSWSQEMETRCTFLAFTCILQKLGTLDKMHLCGIHLFSSGARNSGPATPLWCISLYSLGLGVLDRFHLVIFALSYRQDAPRSMAMVSNCIQRWNYTVGILDRMLPVPGYGIHLYSSGARNSMDRMHPGIPALWPKLALEGLDGGGGRGGGWLPLPLRIPPPPTCISTCQRMGWGRGGGWREATY